MFSGQDCRLCPVHCAVPIFKLPESPCPELLLNNAALPTDSQIPGIINAIERVEEDIRGMDVEVARLQRSLDQVISQRAQLKCFVDRHRGTLSIVRRLPSEILSEIFLRYVDLMQYFNPPGSTLRPILQVCGGWRAIATSPQLWRHFVIKDGLKPHIGFFVQEIPLQLQLSSQIPLSIVLSTNNDYVLNLLLSVSTRWQDITLYLSCSHYRQLFATTCDFPLLKKLAIHSFNTLNRLAADVVRFSEALPALEDLTLNTDYPFGHLTFPWPRLRRCELHRCRGEDLLKILPLLSPGTHVSCWLAEAGIFAPDAPVVSIRSPIRALELHNCQQFVTDVLRSLTAPSLEELTITLFGTEWGSDLTSTIAAFLSRSACALTSLCLRVRLSEDALFSILDSSHTRSIVDLDIGSVFAPISTRYIEVLTTRRLVPDLRVLTFRGHQALEEASVLEMVASRRPVLRELRIQSPKLHPILSQAAVQMLGAEGMEVMLSEYEL